MGSAYRPIGRVLRAGGIAAIPVSAAVAAARDSLALARKR